MVNKKKDKKYLFLIAASLLAMTVSLMIFYMIYDKNSIISAPIEGISEEVMELDTHSSTTTFISGEDHLKDSLEKYHTDMITYCNSETELIYHAYRKLVRDHSGFIAAFSGDLNGKNYKDISNDDLTGIIQDVIQISPPSSVLDGVSFWGNIKEIQKGIIKFDDYTLICISADYKYSEDDMKKLSAYYDSCIKIIYGDSDINSLDDFTKCRKVHDFICENFDYDLTFTNYDDYGGIFHLIDNKNIMVCQGYALMAYKLLKLSGIQSMIVINEDETHSWNLVCIDHKWYQMDVTGDDTGYFNDAYDYKYFLRANLEGNHNYKIKKSSLLYKEISLVTSDEDYDPELWNPENMNRYLYFFLYRFLYEHHLAGFIVSGVCIALLLLVLFRLLVIKSNENKKMKKQIYDDYNSI